MNNIYDFLKSLDNFRVLKPARYPNEYQEVLKLTNFLPEEAGMSQRAWHILNDIYHIVKCSECDNTVRWWVQYKKYREFCSNTCIGKSKKIVERRQATCQQHFNVNVPAQSKTLRQKMTNTLMKNYGVEHPLQSEEIQQRAISKWGGVSSPSLTRFSPSTLLKVKDKNWLIKKHHIEKKSLSQISTLLEGYDVSAISRHMKSHNIEIKHYYSSMGEQQVAMFMSSILPNNQIDINVRTVIPPQELDIYIPSHNLAIEYCGLYWHSEQQGKNKYYHIKKHNKCKEQGIRLLTIFEDEWNNSKNQVKNKLRSLTGQDNNTIIYARKTRPIIIPHNQKRTFFNTNHIQKDGPSSINIGLSYQGELVACMGFIKQKNQHYLNRYATSHRVIGGFSKLLTYFKTHYDWNLLISFADQRWSDGNLYEKTGWTLDSMLQPDYYYSPDGVTRVHKFSYRRKNLQKLLTHFDPDLSERENCNNNGILRIWDCGKLRYTQSNNYQNAIKARDVMYQLDDLITF